MPYIKQDIRNHIDECINQLASLSRQAATSYSYDFDKNRGGILNYIITRIALKFAGTHSYASLSQMKAAMTDAADEWYRRQMAPYEDKKIQENGDVF